MHSHIFRLPFQVECRTPDGSDITNEMFLKAVVDRCEELAASGEWRDALVGPEGSMKTSDEEDEEEEE